MSLLTQTTCRVAHAAGVVAALLLIGSACRAQRQDARVERAEFWAFAAPWDRESDASIAAHGGRLDAIVTGWIGLDSASGRPLLPSPYADTLRPRGARRMAIVTSWHGERFHVASIRSLARDAAALGRASREIAEHARAMGYSGLVLDFETLERRDLAAQLAVVKAIADAARRRGVTMIAAAVPATDTSAYPAAPLLRHVDVIIPMLYDQHWSGSVPGPLSAPDWVRASLALRVAEAGAGRVAAGLPTYGYRWRKDLPTEAVGYVEAQQIAARERVPLRRDHATGTLRAKTGAWEMWVTDAELIARLVRESQAVGVNRFALWRLGREDPAFWSTIGR
jgi:spore germination protein YaaH